MTKTRDLILQIKDLSIRRSDKQIISDVNWSMAAGEHWVILGPNGCGKTSLLSAITAYLSPSSGSIIFMGQRYGATDWSAVRNQIGIVSSALSRKVPPSETALEVVLSGEFSQIGFWSREKRTHDEQAINCLSRLRVENLVDRRWEVLSQGERQKVFIARALMARPKLLILDEPCAGLDPIARKRFLESLSLMTHSIDCPGLILVTHHVEEIFPQISHALVLSGGKAVASGKKEDVLTSDILSRAFGTKVSIQRDVGNGWLLRIDT